MRWLTFSLLIVLTGSSEVFSSSLMHRLREHRTITIQSHLTSTRENRVSLGSSFQLTCSFLSNFDLIDLFWLHNGTLIQSFLSQKVSSSSTNLTFMGVTISSTITFDGIDSQSNGFYQCVGTHDDLHAQQTFHLQVNSKKGKSSKKIPSEHRSITLHTGQAIFEPRPSIWLMCRINLQDRCQIHWYNPDEQLIEHSSLSLNINSTDLVLHNATFDEQMGLYSCRICCSKNKCRQLTSFIYPANIDK